VGSGHPQQVGHFHYDILDSKWVWDDELYRIHGYRPGAVDVNLDLILSHKHPDDRAKASELIQTALRDGEPFSAYQRIVTSGGAVRNIVKVGAGIVDEHLTVVAIDGFYIDVTPSVRSHAQEVADQAVAATVEHRAAIEQAKGMIMLTYNIKADAAFAMLRHWSMTHNTKLNLLAEQLVAAATAVELVQPDQRIRFDRLLDDIARSPDRSDPVARSSDDGR
jgi:hypothetical protein